MNTKAAIYARLSQEDGKNVRKIEDQIKRCRSLAEYRGWDVVAVLDDTRSAFRPDESKPREDYEALLGLIRGHEVEAVIVWEVSRLTRDPEVSAKFRGLGERAGLVVVESSGAEYDLSTARGRRRFSEDTGEANSESDRKSERVKAAVERRVADGEPHCGLGYGWQRRASRTRLVYDVHPEQGPVVAEVVARVLSSDSLAGIARALNEREIPAPRYARWLDRDEDDRPEKQPRKHWTIQSVREIAMRPSNAAIRVHEGVESAGGWPALVSEADYRRVVTRLDDPARRTNAGVRPGSARHLCSSLPQITCSVCGSRLRANNRTLPSGLVLHQYQCAKAGHVTRLRDDLDTYVERVVLGMLPEAVRRLASDTTVIDEVTDEIERREAKLASLDDLFLRDAITDVQYARMTAKVKPLLEAAQQRRSDLLARMDLGALDGFETDVETRWRRLSLAQQRAIIGLIVWKIDVRPASGLTGDDDGVDVVWEADRMAA